MYKTYLAAAGELAHVLHPALSHQRKHLSIHRLLTWLGHAIVQLVGLAQDVLDRAPIGAGKVMPLVCRQAGAQNGEVSSKPAGSSGRAPQVSQLGHAPFVDWNSARYSLCSCFVSATGGCCGGGRVGVAIASAWKGYCAGCGSVQNAG